ncbi:MAG: hypothetical protein V1799_01870 [bacterium]
MKNILTLLIVCLISIPAFAQEETLLEGEIESGGFGGPVVKFGPVNGEFGLFVGGRGGWIINHSFILGGGGYGLVNNVKAKVPSIYGEEYLDFGYGGVEMEYIPHSNKLIHISFMTLIGAGGIGWKDKDNAVMLNNRQRESDAFFIVEPAVNVTLNITQYFRISGGASYRYITGLESAAAKNADVSGPTAMLTFRFGKF